MICEVEFGHSPWRVRQAEPGGRRTVLQSDHGGTSCTQPLCCRERARVEGDDRLGLFFGDARFLDLAGTQPTSLTIPVLSTSFDDGVALSAAASTAKLHRASTPSAK